jgi:hypothetical protein
MVRSGALGKTHLMCGSWDASVRISLLFEKSKPLSPRPYYEHAEEKLLFIFMMDTTVSRRHSTYMSEYDRGGMLCFGGYGHKSKW